MKSLGSTGSFLCALLLVFLSFICTGSSFKQGLWFYDAHDNGLHFQSTVSDMSNYSWFLPKVTKICTRGAWCMFSTTNFTTYYVWSGSASNTNIVCSDFATASPVKSLRHLGARDTDTDALSLYEGEDYLGGTELLITARVHTGITKRIIGIALTGKSDWMLFEGQQLDGESRCFKAPFSDWYLTFDPVVILGLTTVGSVFKGCDLQEIQNYTMLYNSAFLKTLING